MADRLTSASRGRAEATPADELEDLRGQLVAAGASAVDAADLRASLIGGIAFGTVITVGHSFGSATAIVEAATFHDEEGSSRRAP
jgi:hypothetical protein